MNIFLSVKLYARFIFDAPLRQIGKSLKNACLFQIAFKLYGRIMPIKKIIAV